MRIVIPYTERFLNLPNQNFRTMMEAFIAYGAAHGIHIRSLPERELMDHHDFDVLLSIRTYGMQSDAVLAHYRRHGIRLVVWHDDVIHYRWRIPIVYVSPRSRVPFVMSCADIVFLPCWHQAMAHRAYRRHRHKCVWMPWSVPDACVTAARRPWAERRDAVLLSGVDSWQYRLRRRLHLERASLPGLEVLEHPTYDTRAPRHAITGEAFIGRLAEYRYALATTALDVTVGKYMEIPAAGCTMLAEPCSDLPRLGFRDGINCRSIDKRNYRERLQARDPAADAAIADAGRAHVRACHVHSVRIAAMMDVIRAWHRDPAAWRAPEPQAFNVTAA